MARFRLFWPVLAWLGRRAARRPVEWHLARRRRTLWRPPEAAQRRSRFQPRLYDRSGVFGYIHYTEHFVAWGSVLTHLDMLEEGPLQWRVCAFSAGYLHELLAEQGSEGPADPTLPDWAARIAYFDWLESVQEEAHDNAARHSGYVLSAFETVEAKLLEGRSVALQRDEIYLEGRFVGLPADERAERRAEHLALRDVDPAEVEAVTIPAREAGRALARAHRAGG